MPGGRKGGALDVTLSGAVTAKAMEHHPWQRKARAVGLSQKVLAKLLGHAEITVSRQLRGHWGSGTPKHVKFAIRVWGLLTPEQRKLIEDEMERDADEDEAK